MKKSASLALLIAACCALANGQARADSNELGDLFEPFPKNIDAEIPAEAVIESAGHTQKSNYDLRLTTYESNGRFELIDKYPVNPTIGYNAFYLDIHSNSPKLPDRLADFNLDFASPLARLGENWFLAAGVAVGYAGDVPFNQSDAYYGKATLLVGRQLGDDAALVFTLDYNGNRTTFPDIPIPSVAYSRDFGDNLSLTLGLAFISIDWKPTEKLELVVDYQAIDTAEVVARYHLTPHWEWFVRYRTVEQAFHSDLVPENRRILFFQQRVETGLRWEAQENVALVAAIGYAFDTRFEFGFDDRDTQLIERGSDQGYIKLALDMRF